MKRGWIVVGAVVATLMVVVALRVRDGASAQGSGLPSLHAPGASARVARLVPEGTRVRVEVLNATRTRGLGRHATRFLRDRGFDVVDVGNAPAPRESTLVIDRTGRDEWAKAIATALGGARVESRRDSSRYLDVTVLLGATWRPPPQPFYP